MKRSVKITLWVFGSLVVLVFALFLSADIIASLLVKREVSKTFDRLPNADAMVGGIYLNLLSGSAIVKDITFSTNSLTLEDEETNDRAPGLAMHIPTLSIWNINYVELFRSHRLSIFKVTVDDPQVLVFLDEDHPESILPTFPRDSTLDKAQSWLKRLEIRHIEMDDLCARMRSTHSPLRLATDSLSAECHDIAYDFTDSVFTYNDSVYQLTLATAQINLPDGLMAIEAHSLATEDQGPLALGYTRIRNTVTHKQMADLAQEPVTWIDMEMNSLSTSPLNPIRKALAQDCTLDSVRVDVKRMHVIRDERLKPKKPFGTPQQFLRQLPLIFQINYVEALARKIDVDLFTTDVNCGKMRCNNIRAWLTNVTNRPGAVWHNRVKAPFSGKGMVNAHYDIHMDKASSFDLALSGKDLELGDLNPFIRPLVGVTFTCHVDQIDASYKGDQSAAHGTFGFLYHGLDVRVHKEDNIPYKVVTNHADFFTSAANSLIPKSNPTAVDIHPRRYSVEWTRDEWSPYPLYLFGPCIDGIKKTMLPGLYVHKQI